MYIVLVSTVHTLGVIYLHVVDCGPLNTSDNTQLNVTYNSTLLGAVAYYTCLSPEEYTLVGVSYRMCTSTGQWSHQSPYCECMFIYVYIKHYMLF